MKKRIIVFIVVVMFVLNPVNIFVSYGGTTTLIYNQTEHNYNNTNIGIRINGQRISNGAMYPVIIENRTLVPVREVMESGFINATVEWVDQEQKVIIRKDITTIELVIGQETAKVNGIDILLDVPAMLIKDKAINIYKTMVPIRFITETLGFDVQWNSDEQEVRLTKEVEEDYGLMAMSSNIAGLKKSTQYSELPTLLSSNPFVIEATSIEKAVELKEYEDSYYNEDTKIKSITGNSEQSRFYISAVSAMSSIHYFVWDNKLVFDISGANMIDIPSTISMNNSIYVEQVRTSQYVSSPLLGRIVFDLYDNSMPREVIISPDRSSIEVIFNEIGVSKVEIKQDLESDVVALHGNYTDVNVLRLGYPSRLVFDFNHSVNLLGKTKLQEIQGQFIKGFEMISFNEEVTRVVLETVSDSDFEIVYHEDLDETWIRLKPLLFEQMSYLVTDQPYLVIDKKDTALGAYSFTYDYLEKTTVIQFEGLESALSKAESFTIGDDYFNTVNISVENNQSRIKIEGKHIYEFFVKEDDEHIYFYGIRPKELYDIIVVLDPGHGGQQPGTGWNNIVEKDVNLKIMKYLKPYTEQNPKIKYYFTREEDITVYLAPRVDMANDLEAELYVSLHNNALDIGLNPTLSQIRGLEVITTKDMETSATEVAFGELVFKNFGEMLPELLLRSIKNNNKLYVLKHSLMPAVVIEYAYVTNPEDAANLKNETILQEIARITELTISSFLAP